MKKLLPLIYGTMLLAACNSGTKTASTQDSISAKGSTTKRLAGSVDSVATEFKAEEVIKASSGSETSMIYQSLNGIDRQTAVEMITKYKKNADPTPFQLSFFFRRDMIEGMTDLLDKEGADGVRIYYGSPKGTIFNDNETGIILMPTKYCGPNPKLPGMDYHVDYFNHSTGLPYYDVLPDDARGGDRNIDRSINAPALLYTPYTTLDVICNPQNPNAINRATASSMVLIWDKPKAKNTTIGAWYPLSVFKNLLKDKKITGMRVYFARHLSNEAQYIRNKNTFVIVGTKYNPAMLKNVDDFSCLSLSSEPIIKGVEKVLGDPQDMAELCPDNCTICDPANRVEGCIDDPDGGKRAIKKTKTAKL